MPIGFRRSSEATFFVPDTSAQATTANVFDTEGVSWNEYTVPIQFIPGPAKTYDLLAMGYRITGQCRLKVETKYASLVESGSHVKIGGVEWNYQQLSERGMNFGNDRIVLALTRKKSA